MSLSRTTWRFGRAARILIPLLIVCLLPLLVLESTGTALRVGVVNSDEGATVTLPSGTTQFVPFGRQLSAALLDAQERSTADIELLTIDTAVLRFEQGSLDALVLIPADFSTNLSTFGSPGARQANVELHIRPSLARHTQALASYIEESSRHSLARTLNKELLDAMYGGLNSMKDGMRQASDGSAELSSGAAQAAHGINQLHAGSNQLADGLERFSTGINELHQGAGELADGSTELSGGLGQLADGAQQLSRGVDELAVGLTGTPTQPGLMHGINALADGVLGTEQSPGLIQGTRQLADGNRQLADGVEAMHAAIEPLRKLLPPPDNTDAARIDLAATIAQSRAVAQAALDALNATSGVLDTPEAIAALKERLQQLMERCPEAEPEFCAELAALVSLLTPHLEALPERQQNIREALEGFLAHTGSSEFKERIRAAQELLDANGGIQGLLHGPQGALAQLDALRVGIRQLADGAEELAERVGGSEKAPGFAQGVVQLRDGVERLQQGVSGRNRYGERVSDTHLRGGAADLTSGLRQAFEGASAFDAGTHRYRDGVGQANVGVQALNDGAQGLHRGTKEAADGLSRLSDGAHELARGLREGEKKIPEYSPAEQAQIVQVALSPIELSPTPKSATSSAEAHEPVHGARISTMAFILWVVCAVIILRTAPFSAPQLSRPITAAQIAARSLRGPLAVGGALAAVSLGALWVTTPVEMEAASAPLDVWPALGIAITVCSGVVAGLVIHQGLMAISGPRNAPGVAMVGLTVQLIPLVTGPLFHGSVQSSWVEWTPLGALVRSLHAAYFHDGLAQWLGALIALVLWALAFFVLSVLSVNRYRSEHEYAALLETLRQRAS